MDVYFELLIVTRKPFNAKVLHGRKTKRVNTLLPAILLTSRIHLGYSLDLIHSTVLLFCLLFIFLTL